MLYNTAYHYCYFMGIAAGHFLKIKRKKKGARSDKCLKHDCKEDWYA